MPESIQLSPNVQSLNNSLNISQTSIHPKPNLQFNFKANKAKIDFTKLKNLNLEVFKQRKFKMNNLSKIKTEDE